MYCNKCGYENEHGKYCRGCGERLDIETEDIKYTLGGCTLESFQYMIGEGSSYYIKIFKSMQEERKVAPTVLGIIWPIWMLYRKMYLEFFLAIGISYFSRVFGELGNLMISTGITVFMIFRLNQLYYKSILRRMEKYGLCYINRFNKMSYEHLLNKKGGTSVSAPAIYILHIVILTALVIYFA